jgi:pimeloyl-ACP methyl ester carboxylesterase
MADIYLDGFKMHYDMASEGTPLVLWHGLGSSCADWLLQVPVFSETYRVIAPDCRGHGDSDKPPGSHSIPIDQSQRFNQIVLEFLASLTD